MGESLHSYSEKLVFLGRHVAALRAVEALFSAIDGAPAEIRLVSEEVLHTEPDIDARSPVSGSLSDLTMQSIMGTLRYTFVIEADGQRYRIIVHADNVSLSREV